jgi:hypothetical protein
MPEVRLIFVSGRPGAGDWLANTARTREIQYAAFTSIEEALATVRGGSGREPTLARRWSKTKASTVAMPLMPTGRTRPRSLRPDSPHIAETDAFDARYASLPTTP